MSEINSYINPTPVTIRSEGNVPLPIVWGEGHETLEGGGFLDTVGSDGNAITAVGGHKYVRAGSVLVRTGTGNWRLLNESTDTEGAFTYTTDGSSVTVTDAADSKFDVIQNAEAVGILKNTVDLANGGGLVGIYLSGGFFSARMPSIAANGTAGLEAGAVAALRDRGFKFAEDHN